MLTDSFDRKIEYLRLSVTDQCNIRCRYCMPLEKGEVVRRSVENFLTFEEIARLVLIFARLGVRSVRITGGEPLLRKNLPQLIARLQEIDLIEEILLTTNGIFLKDQARDLKASGLTRINIHLDTLNPDKFRDMTRLGNIEDVFAGIEEAQAAGLSPIKLNAVFLKGYNDTEIEDLALFAAERGLILRFIELMPIGPGKEMKGHFLPTSLIRERLSQRWTLLPLGKSLGRGPAEYFQIVELGSVMGLIHPISEPFCGQCNRIRISADGRFQDCLAYDESMTLRDLLRIPGVTDEEIEGGIRGMMGMKREGHGGFLLPCYPATPGMYGIGG